MKICSIDMGQNFRKPVRRMGSRVAGRHALRCVKFHTATLDAETHKPQVDPETQHPSSFHPTWLLSPRTIEPSNHRTRPTDRWGPAKPKPNDLSRTNQAIGLLDFFGKAKKKTMPSLVWSGNRTDRTCSVSLKQRPFSDRTSRSCRSEIRAIRMAHSSELFCTKASGRPKMVSWLCPALSCRLT